MLRLLASSNRRLLVAAGAAGSTVIIGAVAFSNNEVNKASLEQSSSDASNKKPLYSQKPLPTRDEQLSRLSSGQTFDVLVIGGGATGCGIALDAQMRGLNTALIERGDFSSETSSRSTKLVSFRPLLLLRQRFCPRDMHTKQANYLFVSYLLPTRIH